MPRAATALGAIAIGMVALGPVAVQAQDWTHREYPLAPTNARGNFVAPFFDGFYQNADGTWTLSFGFMNRNEEDLVEVPIGPDNFIEPAQYDGVQPTTFPTVSYGGFGGPRERGAFAVVVPEDFEGDVWWTITSNGVTTKVPGRLVSPGPVIHGAYELSITGQAEGSQRPLLRFTEDQPLTWGIEGVEHPTHFRTKVGEPIEVDLWAYDRGQRELRDVNMTLWKYQGPVGAVVSFESLVELPESDEPAASGGGRGGFGRGGARNQEPGPVEVGESIRLPLEGPYADMGRFKASFDMPGEYVIRVRIDNFTSGDSAEGNQCCWSNGYVRVSVTE